jgi:hypothetical protein
MALVQASRTGQNAGFFCRNKNIEFGLTDVGRR